MKLAARVLAIAAASFVFCVITRAEARDLSGRFGLGVSNIGATGLPPSVSLDWRVTQASDFEFNLGVDTDDSANLLLLGTRYFRHVYLEENATFSAVIGGGLLSQSVSGESKSGYFLELGAGSKFQMQGLPNLAFGFVASLGIRSAGAVRFLTQAIFSAHYYF